MKREVLETVIEYKSREDTVLDASPYSYLDIETIDTIRQYSLQHTVRLRVFDSTNKQHLIIGK